MNLGCGTVTYQHEGSSLIYCSISHVPPIGFKYPVSWVDLPAFLCLRSWYEVVHKDTRASPEVGGEWEGGGERKGGREAGRKGRRDGKRGYIHVH